jgi:arginase
LGLRSTGVERLPAALKRANLLAELGAEHGGIIEPPSYDPKRDKTTLLLNLGAIRNYSVRLAEAVASALEKDRFPLVLGGDCSILIGNLWHFAVWDGMDFSLSMVTLTFINPRLP